MTEFFQVMALPFLACLVLTGMHAYLGFHVIERQVIFVDLALAQIAALGAGIAGIAGFGFDSPQAYALSLGFTVFGAFVLSVTRFKKEHVPHEALIGIVYAVSAAMLILVLSRSGEGDEHIRQSLTGNILLVSLSDILIMAGIYAAVGFCHFIFRRQFFLISQNPQQAFDLCLNVRGWDFLFYVLFGIVVASSVKIAGVLLVFAFLIVPPVCSMLFSNRPGVRLLLGWGIGVLASLAGMALSYWGDLPTGASVVCVFGGVLVLLPIVKLFALKST